MDSLFEELGRKHDARRAASKALTYDVLSNAMNMKADTSGMTQAQVDDGIDKSRYDLFSQFAAMPAGLVEGALGIGGDIELLGQGIKEAYKADKGQTLDGFLAGLSDRDTFFPNTMDVQEGTDELLAGTAYGDMLKNGGDGRLLGEFLAPIPTVPGIAKAGKLVGNAIADTVGTGIKAERGMGLSGGINQLLGMTQDPAMVIGPRSSKWNKASEAAFKKAVPDPDDITRQRKALGEFGPTDAEANVWDETAAKGNATFLDIDGGIKQEIPTGEFNIKPRYNSLRKSDLDNQALNSYDELNNGINNSGIAYKDLHPVDAANKGHLGQYNPRTNTMSGNPNKSKAIQRNTMAHEGQHAIQVLEPEFATGSWPGLYKAKNLDDIYDSKDVAKSDAVKNLRAKDMDRYSSLDDGLPEHLSMQEDPSGRGAYLRDPGEMLARATGERVDLDKAGIRKNHILDTYEAEFDQFGIMPDDVLDAKMNELLKGNGIPESNKFPKILDKALANPGNKEYRKYFKGLDIKEGSFKRELQSSGHSHLTFEMNDGRVGKLTNVPNTPDNDHNSLQNTLKYIRNGIQRAGQDIDAGNGRAGGSFEWIQPQKKNNNVSYSMDVKPEQAYRPGYVYKTVNTVDGKKYIGSKLSPQGTQGNYFKDDYYGSGPDLRAAIDEHGIDKFINVKQQDTTSFDDIVKTEEGLLTRVDAAGSDDYYNNINKYKVGKGAYPSKATKDKLRKLHTGSKRSAKAKENMSKAQKGKKRGPMSKEHKKAISKANKGRPGVNYGPMSKEQKLKISKANKGKKKPAFTEEHKRKLSEARKGQPAHNKGKKASLETRKKLSEAHMGITSGNKGKKATDETRKRMSESAKNRKTKGLL